MKNKQGSKRSRPTESVHQSANENDLKNIVDRVVIALQQEAIAKQQVAIPSQGKDQLIIQEAIIIGQRIQWYLDQHEKIETLALISTGTIWAFILSQKYSESIKYISWIPLFLTFFLTVKNYLFTKTINEAFQYLYELEEYYDLGGEKGWVHYFRHRSSKFKRKWRAVFWSILIVANVLIPLLFPFEKLLQSGK